MDVSLFIGFILSLIAAF